MEGSPQPGGENRQSERVDQGLPGDPSHNREDTEPQEPTRRTPGEDEESDDSRKGGAGEHSQATGDPNAAG